MKLIVTNKRESQTHNKLKPARPGSDGVAPFPACVVMFAESTRGIAEVNTGAFDPGFCSLVVVYYVLVVNIFHTNERQKYQNKQ
jgi:hypothetical protein